MTEVYFNRPKRPIDLSRLFTDIAETKIFLGMAAAWFTDTNLAQAILDSPAEEKWIVLNRADIKRASQKAYKMIANRGDIHFEVIGGEDWQNGVMHNKFIVTDNSVWTGSYNWTFNAQNNYENIIRINDPEAIKAYQLEVRIMLLDEPALYQGSTQFASSNGAFRCFDCEQLYNYKDLGEDGYSWQQCIYCKEKAQNVRV